MYQLMINRKNSKKGFTLVEVIVVLVILAILAAIMIPAMTGWITRAQDKSIIVEGRSALLACQTLASESFAKGTPTVDVDEAKTLAGLDGTIAVTAIDTSTGQVTGMTYTNGKTATYNANSTEPWTVS